MSNFNPGNPLLQQTFAIEDTEAGTTLRAIDLYIDTPVGTEFSLYMNSSFGGSEQYADGCGFTTACAISTGPGFYRFFFNESTYTLPPSPSTRGFTLRILSSSSEGNASIWGSLGDTITGSCISNPGIFDCGDVSDAYLIVYDEDPGPLVPETDCIGSYTQICSFDPQDNSTTTGPTVDFRLEAYINPADISGISGIKITLHNIDQNVLLLGALSPSDIYLFEGEATSSGQFLFSTSTVIADGNYRLEACLDRSYFGGFLINPFANVIEGDEDCQSHQFVVGEGTFIGDVSQNGYDIFHELISTTTATSTVSANTCSFWYPSTFNIFKCGTFLLVPDANYLNITLNSFKNGVLTRMPWGYLTRTYNILTSTTTSELPVISVDVPIGMSTTTDIIDIHFDPNEMLAEAGVLLNDTRSAGGKNIRDILESLVQFSVAMAVLMVIIWDLTHGKAQEGPGEVTKNTK